MGRVSDTPRAARSPLRARRPSRETHTHARRRSIKMCKAPKEDEFRGAESTGASKGLMAGANLFGLINAVLTCVVLGIVATRGGDTTKNTTNNAAAAGRPRPTTTTVSGR